MSENTEAPDDGEVWEQVTMTSHGNIVEVTVHTIGDKRTKETNNGRN